MMKIQQPQYDMHSKHVRALTWPKSLHLSRGMRCDDVRMVWILSQAGSSQNTQVLKYKMLHSDLKGYITIEGAIQPLLLAP